ncbi:hypothetical protein HK102_008907, partial [Quaeritorhiza haematococci]
MDHSEESLQAQQLQKRCETLLDSLESMIEAAREMKKQGGNSSQGNGSSPPRYKARKGKNEDEEE